MSWVTDQVGGMLGNLSPPASSSGLLLLHATELSEGKESFKFTLALRLRQACLLSLLLLLGNWKAWRTVTESYLAIGKGVRNILAHQISTQVVGKLSTVCSRQFTLVAGAVT